MEDNFEELFGFETPKVEETTENTTTETETETVEETVEEAATEVEETVEETTDETTKEAPAPTDSKGENFVPLAVLMEEREKARTNKSEAEALRQRIAELEAAKAQSGHPDPYDDPEGYNKFVQQQVAAQVAEQMQMHRFQTARAQAVAEHGESYVNELADWADEYAKNVDPQIGSKALNSPDPVKFVADLRKRHTAIQAIETDEAAFIRQRALELGLIPKVETPTLAEAQPTPKKPVGPKSIATISNRETSQNEGPTSLDDIF